MHHVLAAFTLLWRYQARFWFCFLALPLLAYLYQENKVESFTATTSFFIDPSLVESPLLKDVSLAPHREILARVLGKPSLLTSSLTQAGLTLPGAAADEVAAQASALQGQLRLYSVGKNMLQIDLTHPERAVVLPLLTAVSHNFRQELLGPERFGQDEKITRLQYKIDYYRKQISFMRANPAQEVFPPSMLPTMEGALKASEQDLAQAMRHQRAGDPELAIRLVEAPTLVANSGQVTWFGFLTWLLAGLALGLVVVALSRWLDHSLRTDDEIQAELGQRIIGRMPYFGQLHVQNGRQTT